MAGRSRVGNCQNLSHAAWRQELLHYFLLARRLQKTVRTVDNLMRRGILRYRFQTDSFTMTDAVGKMMSLAKRNLGITVQD